MSEVKRKTAVKRNKASQAKTGKPNQSKEAKSHKGQVGKQLEAKEQDSKKQDAKKPCPAMGKCGGCQYLNLAYPEQLAKKQEFLKKTCGSLVKFEPIIGMEQPKHYRNKVHAAFGEDRRHEIISGQFEERSHRIVPIDSCLLENQKADQIIVSIRGLLKSFKIRPYNEDTGYGLLRYVMVRTGHVTGEIMVVLVIASPVMPSKNNFVKALLKLHPEITTVVLNINNRGDSMVLGEREQVLYGKGYIEDVLCGKTFRISAKSFYQVNPVQAEKLYNKAIEFAGLTGQERVLDAYCGTGTIGMIAADHAKEVIGVELNKDAVRDAVSNAKRNNVSNIQFYQQDAGKFMVDLAEKGEQIDVVIMDPPRAGSDEAFLSSVVKLKPKKVVYVSCNPETLARDLKYLTRKGYQVKKGVGVDMFPWSVHIESVVSLVRK